MSVSGTTKYETATAKYVRVNKLIREILIEIAPFHGTSVGGSSIQKEVYLLQVNFSDRSIKKRKIKIILPLYMIYNLTITGKFYRTEVYLSILYLSIAS